METEVLTNERELLDKIAGGDEQAFTALFEHYYHALGSHLFKLTRSMQTAEEIVQDVFLKIWIAREALLEVRDFKAYLFIASKNHAINAIKKAAREQEKQQAFEANTRLTIVREEESTGEIEDQYYSLLDKAIDKLPQQQQKVFILSRRRRMKYEEIAREMNISKESVKKYMQHATRSISDYVREHMDPALVALLLLNEYQVHQVAGLH